MEPFEKVSPCSTKSLNCSVCEKGFKYKSKLLRHELVHSKVKNFQCAYCFKSFSLPYNLEVHKRIHFGVKPYKCKFPGCGKSFTQSNNLTVHEKAHNIKPFALDPSLRVEDILQRIQRKFEINERLTSVDSEFEMETAMSDSELF